MKTSGDWIWKVSRSFAFVVLYLAFIGYTADHWPSGYEILRYALMGFIGVCFVWLFIIKPFRSGLRGDSERLTTSKIHHD